MIDPTKCPHLLKVRPAEIEIGGTIRKLVGCGLVAKTVGYVSAFEPSYCQTCCAGCDEFPTEVLTNSSLIHLSSKCLVVRLMDYRESADELKQFANCSREQAIVRAAELGVPKDILQRALVQSVKLGFSPSEAMLLNKQIL